MNGLQGKEDAMIRRSVSLVLASRSTRRAGLLRAAGYRFQVRYPCVDEVLVSGESPAGAAERLAREKARDVARRVRTGRILGADTLVVVGRDVLGKPVDSPDARRMLGLLSGRTHRVITGVALCRTGGRGMQSAHAVTRVAFKKLSSREIDWYLSTAEPIDKAGAYGIQGGAALFATAIAGSHSNVVGLPLELVYTLLGLPG
jgi:septum formation protein